jgi:N6-adenosine-specific RNA methylase IME4
MEITIDPEFKALIPPLAADELRQLEENILRDGCRDPLVVWQTFDEYVDPDCVKAAECGGKVYCKYCYKNQTVSFGDGIIVCDECDYGLSPYRHDFILIDGHNRHEICTRNGLPFETIAMVFESREVVMDWMDANQLGRRNLSPDAFKLALGRRYNRAKAKRGGDTSKRQNVALELAKEHSVSDRTVQRAGSFAEEVARLPELQRAIAEGKPVLQVKREIKEREREARREENRAKVSEAQAPEDIIKSAAKFATIVIDPPWDWGDEGDQDQMGRARPDYATMSKEQLMALPVGTLADDDCHLYMWITNRSLPKGFDLIQAWGFRYITAITWAKPSFGMGNYFRGQTEQILFAVKGSQPLKRKDVGTLFTAPRGPNGHSSKPLEFYDLVESCSPGPFLEMFSRHNRDGWTAWGEGQ